MTTVTALELAAANPIMCGACGTLPLHAISNGDFACPDGHAIDRRGLVLDPDETWCITPAGLLAYVTEPAAALRRMAEAGDAMRAGATGWELDDANTAYAEAVAALLAARAVGLTLPEGGQR
jgi:hypothetical protein